MIKKSLLVWIVIIPLAILNGALREMILNPLAGEKLAQPLSGVLLCLLIFIVCCLGIPRIGRGTARTYWVIGLWWMLLTVLFETGFGLLTGDGFVDLMKAYDVTTGNLWLVVVLFMGTAPRLTAGMKKLVL